MDRSDYKIFKIKKTPLNLVSVIDNIAMNQEMKRSAFLREQLRVIVNAYPNWMHTAPEKNAEKIEFHIQNLHPDIKMKISAICKNMGVSQNNFIKMELQKILNTYPEDMKRPPQKL